MLSINRTKELLNDLTISDEGAEKIRDSMQIFCEIIFESWQEDKLNKNENEKENTRKNKV